MAACFVMDRPQFFYIIDLLVDSGINAGSKDSNYEIIINLQKKLAFPEKTV
jgi:hypothetical protein